MFKRKLQGCINRLKDELKIAKNRLKREMKERENITDNPADRFRQYSEYTNELHSELYEIDITIESMRGFVQGLEFAIERLNMLKESIDNNSPQTILLPIDELKESLSNLAWDCQSGWINEVCEKWTDKQVRETSNNIINSLIVKDK